MNEFAGFPAPTKNFFSLPNEIINIIADITNLSELKIIIYVIRHTWGYHEFGICKTISIDEFMKGRRYKDSSRMDKGTGLSRQGVLDGLERAVKDGYLICEIDASDLGRTKKSYRLKMLGGVNDLDGVHNLDPVNVLDAGGSKTQTPEVNDLDPRGQRFRPRSEKETKEKHSRKTSEERKNDSPTSPHPDALSLSSSSQEIDSSVEASPQGEVTLPPPSVKGVSLSAATGGGTISSSPGGEDDTLNLANAQHEAVQQSSSSVASPIVMQTGTETLDKQESSSSAQGYKNHSVPRGDSCVITQEQDPPDSDALPVESGITVTQEQLLKWLKSAHVGLGKEDARRQEAIDTLLPLVRSEDHVQLLVSIVRTRYPKGAIWLSNLTKEWVIAEFESRTTEEPERSPFVGMTKAQADTFAQWLMQKPGFCWETVAIDKPYPDRDAWTLCVQYAPDQWLYFESPEHWNNASSWELERIEEAMTFGRQFAQPLEAAI